MAKAGGDQGRSRPAREGIPRSAAVRYYLLGFVLLRQAVNSALPEIVAKKTLHEAPVQ
jgi:hypothetical protein